MASLQEAGDAVFVTVDGGCRREREGNVKERLRSAMENGCEGKTEAKRN